MATASTPTDESASSGAAQPREHEPALRFPPPRPFSLDGEDAEVRLLAASMLVAARLSRAHRRGDQDLIPSGWEGITPLLEDQWGFAPDCARAVAEHAWYSDRQAAEQAVIQAIETGRAGPRSQHLQSSARGVEPQTGRVPTDMRQDVHHEPTPEPLSPAGPSTSPQTAPYGSRVQAEAQSLRINGLLRAAVLAAEAAGLDSNPRMAGALQQIRDAWEPIDQRGIPDGPAAAAQRYGHLLNACQLLDRQIGADQATGLLSGDTVQKARQQVWELVADTQTHVERLSAAADHPRPQPFTGRGPAERASHAVATACEAWAATPLGRKAMDGELPDHAGTIARVRGAWQEIYDHGLNSAADAAPRFYRLAEALHALEEGVLSDGTTRGLWTRPLHEAADQALDVSQRLTATGDLHAWQGNRAQARRWERHHRPVLGLPTRLSDRASTLLGRIRRDGAAANGRSNESAGRARSTARTPAGTTAGLAARMFRRSNREGRTGR